MEIVKGRRISNAHQQYNSRAGSQKNNKSKLTSSGTGENRGIHRITPL